MTEKCYKTNNFNPMGNFLPFDSRTRAQNCEVSSEQDKIYKLENQFSKLFYSMPVTTSYPDTSGFAKYLFPDPARCRDTGYLCMTNADSTINIDRMGIYNNEIVYQPINQNYVRDKEMLISSYGWAGIIRK
jgi:hypothetical protein